MAVTDAALIPVQSGGAEGWRDLFALVLAFAFILGLAFIMLMQKWKRPDLDTEHAAHVLSQLDGFGGTGGGAVVVRSVDALSDGDTIADIRGLFRGERSGEVRVRSATREIIREVRSELRSRTPAVSKVPARAAQEAVLTAVFGALAILPVAVWSEAASSGVGTVPTLPDIIAGGNTVLNSALGAATAFPYTDVIFAFGLSFGIIGVETIWALWWAPPITLTALAVSYWVLERRLETEREPSGPPVRSWTRRFLTLAVITWFVGTSLATIGGYIPTIARIPTAVIIAAVFVALYVRLNTRSVDPPEESEERPEVPDLPQAVESPQVRKGSESAETLQFVEIAKTGDSANRDTSPPSLPKRVITRIRRADWKWMGFTAILGLGFAHELMALLAAATVMAVVLSVWGHHTLKTWSWSARKQGRDAFALEVIHSVTVTTAALTLPLMVGYAFAALGTGKALRVARAVTVDTPSGTVLALGVLAVMVVLTAAVAFLSRFSDLRMGIRRALSVSSVRLALFGKALPFALMVITAIIALAIAGTNLVAVIAATLAVGLIARFAFKLYHYANYRYQTREPRESVAARVVINGRQVTDADGEPVYVADVNGHRTAHRNLETLIGQIQEDTRSLFRGEQAEKGSFPRYYYLNGVRRGMVDMESVADELLGDVRTRFEANVKQTDADADDIMEKLRGEYPSHVVQKVVNRLLEKGMVSRRENEYRWLGR